jgi:hypothetical protein
MQDRFDVHALFVRYATSLDACDADGVVACFEADGWLESPVLGRFDGADGIRAFALWTSRQRDEGVQHRHVVINLRVETDGDAGRARCYLLDFATRDGATELGSPDEYDCGLTRRSGGWRFTHRSLVMDRRPPPRSTQPRGQTR